MNTPEDNIKDSLLNAHQGAVLSAIGSFGDKMKGFFTESAQNLNTVVSRLGVGAAALAIVTMAGLAAPGQAMAQTNWANASPWATAGTVNDAFQNQRQLDLVQQGGRVIGDARGLNYKEQNIVNLIGQVPGAFTSGSKATALTAVAGLGAAAFLPATNTSNGTFINGGGNNGSYGGNNGGSLAAPWGNSGGGGGYQQNNNTQGQAMQQAFASYAQYAEPQYQVALQANMQGNLQARHDAVQSFGNAWNAASQVGVPLHTIPDQVNKFQQMQKMDPQALQAGLAGVRPQQPQIVYGQGMNR